jgi:hypothetical protein
MTATEREGKRPCRSAKQRLGLSSDAHSWVRASEKSCVPFESRSRKGTGIAHPEGLAVGASLHDRSPAAGFKALDDDRIDVPHVDAFAVGSLLYERCRLGSSAQPRLRWSGSPPAGCTSPESAVGNRAVIVAATAVAATVIVRCPATSRCPGSPVRSGVRPQVSTWYASANQPVLEPKRRFRTA